MKCIHIIQRLGRGWAVRRTRARRAINVLPTKPEAIELGKDLAQESATCLYVHKPDGSIEDRFDYTQDRKVRAAVHKVLHNPNSSKKSKTARGSALSQR